MKPFASWLIDKTDDCDKPSWVEKVLKRKLEYVSTPLEDDANPRMFIKSRISNNGCFIINYF
jgi:hypothetical protein